MTNRLTDEDMDRIFSKGNLIGTRKFIKYGIKRYGLTFEDSRELLYGALEDGLIRLTNHYQLERVE